MKKNNRFLKLKQVMSITGIGRSTIYFWMKQSLFPASIKLGERSIGWLEADIEGWMDERISESSNPKKDVHPLDINPLKELEDNVKQKSKELKMNNITEIKPSKEKEKEKEKLANEWLWNPWLVADITRCINQSIGSSQTVQEQDFHYLEWSRLGGKTDVYLEIRDGVQTLILNTDRWRGNNERLALIGIAATYNLTYGECTDE